MAKPENSGRDQGGTFKKGTSGNPAGKPKGTRNKTSLAVEELLQGEHGGLTCAAIDKALKGDTTALRLCLDRIEPVRKDAPFAFELTEIETAQDALTASSALLSAVAGGEVTPDEGGRVMALLTAHKQLVESCDLESRITALEEARK